MIRSSNNSVSRMTLNSNRNSSAKKSNIKTSALLFYQSPNQHCSRQFIQQSKSNYQNSICKETGMNSSRRSIHHSRSMSNMQKQNEKSMNNYQQGGCCYNHRNMAAEYISCTTEGEKIYYCEKCARLLVEQGFSVIAISQQQEQQSVVNKSKKDYYGYPYYQERCGEIKNFENRLQDLLTNTNGKIQQLKDVLMQSEEFYGQQIQDITAYFQQIMQQLEFQKNKCYNHILKERAEAQSHSRNTLKSILEYQKQINDIVSDIEENIDEVYTVQRNNYQMVLDSFMEKVQTIQYELFQRDGGVSIRDIEFRKIEFMGVPDSINSLSEIILKSYGSEGQVSAGILGSISLNEDYTDKNQDRNSSNILNKNNTLMFSFDGQKMKSYSQIVNQPMKQSAQHGYDEETDTVRCKNSKEYLLGGIKEVELSDAIGEVDYDDELLYCTENDQ